MKFLFLGDSITEGFNVKIFLPDYNIDNKGVSGDSTIETLHQINNIDFSIGYNKIFLCIGTNDLARKRSINEIATNISKIITLIHEKSPQSKIFVHSIFPTRENSPRPIENIIRLNVTILSLSYTFNFTFINSFSEFTDGDTLLKEEYTEDGLHLTNLAYSKWAEIIKKYLGR
ncbi:MAG TPA: GDSL-type esterase/lipase family protein [Melioribacteraceae bacterium]|nr:GDSL-type esterase/lipase family protein [Melioribacteraceae bacterium]